MDVLDLARLQFAITTVYHFFFVPVTIGLSAIVAGLQTAWVLRGRARYLRLTRFFGKVLVINFAMGVVTGLVQEFQFGMNWSAYSVFVGEVVGVPLAIEGLLAFFLEATFLGLWIFGWDRLPRLVHLACIWVVAIGTQISAYVILAVNSWMQHPVGHRIDPATGRVQLADFGALLTSPVALAAGAHTATACFLTGGALVAGIAFWQLARRRTPDSDRSAFRSAAIVGGAVVLVSSVGFVVTGDHQMKLLVHEQPMKVAAAEALYDTEGPAPFTLVPNVEVPYVLSFLATGDVDGEVEGMNDIQERYARTYGPGDYSPDVSTTFWSFRLMIGLGGLVAGLVLIGLWLLWKRPAALRGRTVGRLALLLPFLPLLANTAGWVFTETGRQPWLAFGLFQTADGVSPGTTAGELAVSLGVFTVLYSVLAVIELGLLRRAVQELPPAEAPVEPEDNPQPTLALSY